MILLWLWLNIALVASVPLNTSRDLRETFQPEETSKTDISTGNFITNDATLPENTLPLAENRPKPHIYVTFLSEKIRPNPEDNSDMMHEQPEVPQFLDPMQRFLMYFLSSLGKEVVSEPETPVEQEVKRSAPKFLNTVKAQVNNATPVVVNQTKHLGEMIATKIRTIGKKREHRMARLRCVHQKDGSDVCQVCGGNSLDFDAEPGSLEKRQITEGAKTTSQKENEPATIVPFKVGKVLDEERHYFLSISGDTDKRVAAPNEGQKLDGDQQFNSSNDKDATVAKHQHYVLHPYPYFWAITVPVVVFMIGLIVGFSIFTRKNGTCCQLFLVEPKEMAYIIEKNKMDDAKNRFPPIL